MTFFHCRINLKIISLHFSGQLVAYVVTSDLLIQEIKNIAVLHFIIHFHFAVSSVLSYTPHVFVHVSEKWNFMQNVSTSFPYKSNPFLESWNLRIYIQVASGHTLLLTAERWVGNFV